MPLFLDDLLRLDFAFDPPIHAISNNRHMRISHSVKAGLNCLQNGCDRRSATDAKGLDAARQLASCSYMNGNMARR
ncbi:hypothetical protein BFJ70_g17508 [Fusarium oxysporum]|nr:hypothetical protein BFJ70_g17508 [Fusarium oxysporum]